MNDSVFPVSRPAPTRAELTAELAEARAAFEQAESDYRLADRAKSAAVRRVSDAEKKIDAAIAELKSGAPWDSHWGSARQRGTRA